MNEKLSNCQIEPMSKSIFDVVSRAYLHRHDHRPSSPKAEPWPTEMNLRDLEELYGQTCMLSLFLSVSVSRSEVLKRGSEMQIRRPGSNAQAKEGRW